MSPAAAGARPLRVLMLNERDLGHPLAGGVEATSQQCQAMLGTALESCEGYFPAYQFVVWAGKESREALASTMFETEGRA